MASRSRVPRRSSQPLLSPKPPAPYNPNSTFFAEISMLEGQRQAELMRGRTMNKRILPNIAPREKVNFVNPPKVPISSKKRQSIVFEMPHEIEKAPVEGEKVAVTSQQPILPKVASVLKKDASGTTSGSSSNSNTSSAHHYVPRRMSTPATLIPYFYKSSMHSMHQMPTPVPVITPLPYNYSSATASPPSRKRISIADLIESTSDASLNSSAPSPIYGIDRMVPHVAPLPTIPSVAPSIKYQSLMASSIIPYISPRTRSSSVSRQGRKSVDHHDSSKQSSGSSGAGKKDSNTLSRSSRKSVDSGSLVRRGKSIHNMAERIRRQNLNDRIRELQSLLPVSSPTSTCETLQLAAEYIDRLTSVGALFQRELAKVNFQPAAAL